MFNANATIHLLFKKGDPQSLANWRTKSLLNVDYKILAKIINFRMSKILPLILNPDQKGFVPTRNLDDAVLKTTHLINYCKRHNKPMYLMLLDQEKAFDQVSREFTFRTLDKFNFPPFIINAITSMYANTTVNISINGQNSRTLHLKSGVRQGCPLSPTLFAICIEALGNLIRQNDNFQGIIIPNTGQY